MTPEMLGAHRAHDYRHLVQRWRKVARIGRLEMKPFAEVDGLPLYVLRSPALTTNDGIYISAGIHGDEPGGTEGLIAWAESSAENLRNCPLLLFPCLNAWGLVQNHRTDRRGRDPNRAWDRARLPLISAVRREIKGMRFALAMMLHEDYDAQGLYLYEPHAIAPHWGEDLLRSAAHVIKIDPRQKIDRRRATIPGVIRWRLRSDLYARIGGLPEAVYLHVHHARRTFTVETPSEFALDVRVRAQMSVIQKCVELACEENRSTR
jgi:protein MpaA